MGSDQANAIYLIDIYRDNLYISGKMALRTFFRRQKTHLRDIF